METELQAGLQGICQAYISEELSMLVEQEYSTGLTEKDSNRYVKLVTLLHGYGVPIEYGIEI